MGGWAWGERRGRGRWVAIVGRGAVVWPLRPDGGEMGAERLAEAVRVEGCLNRELNVVQMVESGHTPSHLHRGLGLYDPARANGCIAS
jgi:hypothetical protein